MKTIASTALRSSFARARSIASAPVSAANPTSTCSSRRRRGDRARMSGVGSSRSSRPSPRLAGDLRVLGRSAARKSAGAAAISSTPAAGNSAATASASSSVVSTSIARTPPGSGSADVGGDQRHLGAAPRRRGREGEPHPAARAVADEAHRVDRLAGAAGGDQDAEPVPGAVRARQRSLDLGEQARGLRAGARRRARRARRAAPASGSITRITPRSRRVARFAWVAASAYIRSFIAGATSRGAVQARNAVVRIESQMPAASLAIVFADAGATRKASALETTSRWPIGSWSGAGSPGKAPRIGSRSNSETSTGAPTMPSNDAGADEALGGRRHQHAHAVAGLGRQAGELERLVGGDAAAHSEQDAGHTRMLRRGDAPSPGARLRPGR